MSVELPKDHEGREIPLDTKVLYDLCETKVSVKEFLFRTVVESQKIEWTIEAQYEGNLYYNSFKPENMHITQPDSWKSCLKTWARQVTRGIKRLVPTFTETKAKMAVHRARVARTAALELPCATLQTVSAN